MRRVCIFTAIFKRCRALPSQQHAAQALPSSMLWRSGFCLLNPSADAFSYDLTNLAAG